MKKTLAAILALVLTLSLCSLAWATQPSVNVAKIGDNEYATLQAAFDAAKDGDTITLLKSCSGDGVVAAEGKYPTGLTVDFAGHSYTVGGVLVGSSGTASNAFQLLKGNTITFKNGAIYGDAAVAGDATTEWTGAPAMMIQNYSNLTLLNMVVSGGEETVYTISNNNGDSVFENTTINPGKAKGYSSAPVAFDVCRYSSYPSVSVTVKGTSKINGDVEVSGDIGQGQSRQLNIENGTFGGAFKISGNVPANISVSGGTFASSVREYVVPALQYEVMTTVNEANNEYTYNYFTKYEDAVAYAESTVNKGTIDLTQGSTNLQYVIEYADGTGREVTLRVVAGQDFELPTLTRTGYTFKGWKMNGSTEVYSAQQIKAWTGPLGDTNVLTAVWSANSYYYYPSTSTTDSTTGKASPKTFDAGIGVYAVTAVLSLTGLAYTGKKKF